MRDYFWHQKNWTHLTALYENQEKTQHRTFPSALLLWGLKGLGKYHFAEQLSAWLLCEHRKNNLSGDPCGQCASCQWLDAGTHPDQLILTPESDSTRIKVDAVRTIHAFSERTSHGGQHRVIIISPAEAMNSSAANALLKILEEPFDNTIFILVSHHISWLLPTIRSRCQQCYFPPLNTLDFQHAMQNQRCPEEIILDLYTLTQGAPLMFDTLKVQKNAVLAKNKLFALMDEWLHSSAKQWDPIRATETIKAIEKESGLPMENLVDILLHYFHQASKINTIKNNANIIIYTIYDKLLQIKKQIKAGMNINQVIWFEALLCQTLY